MEFIIKILSCVIIGIIGLIFSLQIFINGFGYIFDKSICDVYVDEKQVYNDRCHFINMSSIGENGNTKRLTIYSDIFGFKPIKTYVSDNIIIK